MNSYQKRTFMKRGPFDVDLTRIWIKASIKEFKGERIKFVTRNLHYFVTQKAPMSRVCHAPGREGCAQHLVVLCEPLWAGDRVFAALPPPPGTMAQCALLTSHLTA